MKTKCVLVMATSDSLQLSPEEPCVKCYKGAADAPSVCLLKPDHLC